MTLHFVAQYLRNKGGKKPVSYLVGVLCPLLVGRGSVVDLAESKVLWRVIEEPEALAAQVCAQPGGHLIPAVQALDGLTPHPAAADMQTGGSTTTGQRLGKHIQVKV